MPGLAEVDAKYGPMVEQLKNVKKLIYNADGSLKDNAVSTLNNLLNKGKEGAAANLKQIMPNFDDFSKQVKLAKAVEDINISKDQKVGHYFKAGIAGTLLSGGTGAIPAMILSHPEVMTSILKSAGKVAGKTEAFMAPITDKIASGQKLVGKEAKFVSDALQQVTTPAAKAALLGGLSRVGNKQGNESITP